MDFLPVVRQLAQAYQAFESYSAADMRERGLTLTQFDVIATLGNQPPMSCKALGEKTLVTKGTLTGVLERLQAKGLISREINPEDGRSQLISLTRSGQKLFEKNFPQHVAYLSKAFGRLSATELKNIHVALETLRAALS